MAALCWSSCEETPQAQGKRNPSKMVGVARGHQRADTLKPYSQKNSQSNHTRTIALSNSMKPNHASGAAQGELWWRGLTECGPLEKGMANHFSILALKTPWTVWKVILPGTNRNYFIKLIKSSENESHSVMSDSLWPHRLYSPWNSPGQNTGVGSLSLLQGIFPNQGSNWGLPHCRQILYQLSH